VDRQSTHVSRSKRGHLVAIAAIGAALVVMPFAFNMFNKTPQGAVMIAQFKPFMTAHRLDGFQTDLKEINAGVRQTNTKVAAYLSDGSANRAAFDSTYPTFASFNQQWPAIDSKMTGLMNQVQGNLGNYLAVAALPSFRLFPWFFTGVAAPSTALGPGTVGARRARGRLHCRTGYLPDVPTGPQGRPDDDCVQDD
jgi:hypothetical protein